MADRSPCPNAPPNIKRLHFESKSNMRLAKRKQVLKNGFTKAAKRRLLFLPEDERPPWYTSSMKTTKKARPVTTGSLKADPQSSKVGNSTPTSQVLLNDPCTSRALNISESSTPNRRAWQSLNRHCFTLSGEFEVKVDMNSPTSTNPSLAVPSISSINSTVESVLKVTQHEIINPTSPSLPITSQSSINCAVESIPKVTQHESINPTNPSLAVPSHSSINSAVESPPKVTQHFSINTPKHSE